MNLTILQYNNYFNRVAKKAGTTLSAYRTAANAYYTTSATNFNRADGVNTTHTINYYTNDLGNVLNDNIEYDYAVLTDSNGNVESRWFIIESKWNRKGQRLLTLRRDLIIDYYDDYKNAPAFIEKGIVPTTDSFIYNSEGVTFSQVLKEQKLITGAAGDSATGYIVGFQSKKYDGSVTISQAGYDSFERIEDLPFYSDYSAGRHNQSSKDFYMTYKLQATPGNYQATAYQYGAAGGTPKGNSSVIEDGSSEMNAGALLDGVSTRTQLQGACSALTILVRGNSVDVTTLFDDMKHIFKPRTYSYIDKYNGYKCSIAGKGYKFVKTSLGTFTQQRNSIPASTLSAYISDVGSGGWTVGLLEPKNFIANWQYEEFGLVMQADMTIDSYTWPKAPAHTGSSYDIFYMVADTTAMKMAGEMAEALGSFIFDIQLFPYKPPDTTYTQTVNGKTIYYPTSISASLTKSISMSTSLKSYKLSALADMYRITSPDHAHSFDIQPRQNGMTNTFDLTISYSLIPLGSYIRISPTFAKLYGATQTKEIRGLVFQGSFSVPMSSSQWSEYKIQNSAYADSFERSIEHMEVSQNYQRMGDIVGAIAGTMSATSQGAALGSAGGAAGAAVSGVVGAVGGVATGIADVMINDSMRKEQLDFTKDMFGFSMRNIQARPTTIRSVGAFATENFLFPYIQLYSCTDDEEDAWEEKEKYNAWTIGRIGKFSDFHTRAVAASSPSRYIKCALIRTSASDTYTTEDTHLWTEIGAELYKGVYDYL